MSTKAVYLDWVSDLTSASIASALQRLSDMRGNVRIVYSDNATNFVGISNQLKNAANLNRIEWKHIPPYSPHIGGIWESLAKSVKTLLLRTHQKLVLTAEEWRTTLSRISAILNSRPLVEGSISEGIFPLTPNHFLTGRNQNSDLVGELDFKETIQNKWSNYKKHRMTFGNYGQDHIY